MLRWYIVCSRYKVNKKAEIKNRYNQAPHLTQDSMIWKSEKKATKHHIPESQEVSPFHTGYREAARKIIRQYDKDRHESQITRGSTKEAPPWNGQ